MDASERAIKKLLGSDIANLPHPATGMRVVGFCYDPNDLDWSNAKEGPTLALMLVRALALEKSGALRDSLSPALGCWASGGEGD